MNGLVAYGTDDEEEEEEQQQQEGASQRAEPASSRYTSPAVSVEASRSPWVVGGSDTWRSPMPAEPESMASLLYSPPERPLGRMMMEIDGGGEGGVGGGGYEEEEDTTYFDQLPPEPDAPCDPDIQKKVVKYLDEHGGTPFSTGFKGKKEFGNPELLANTIRQFELKECGSNYPRHLFNPVGYSPSDFIDEIRATQRKLENETHVKRGVPPPAAPPGPPPVASGGGGGGATRSASQPSGAGSSAPRPAGRGTPLASGVGTAAIAAAAQSQRVSKWGAPPPGQQPPLPPLAPPQAYATQIQANLAKAQAEAAALRIAGRMVVGPGSQAPMQQLTPPDGRPEKRGKFDS